MNLNLNQHKATIALGLLSAACATFLPYIPGISAGLAASIMGFIGTVLATVKTYQEMPPAKVQSEPPPRVHISGLIVFLIVALGVTACTKQQARSAVDDATLACTLLKSLDPTIGDVCATEAEIAPIVKHLLAARRVRKFGVAPGASSAPVDACTVPLEVKP